MTATDITREAQWAGPNRHNVALPGVRTTLARLYGASRPTLSCRFPPSVARLPAFTVSLDTERLDIGLAAMAGNYRRQFVAMKGIRE